MTTRELSASAIGLRLSVRRHRRCVACGRSVFATMTLKIAAEHTTVIRLIGRLRREHLGIVTKQIQSCTGEVTIDLGELALISVEGVRFLNACQDQGIFVANVSPYVTDWMKRERMPTDDDPC
jgi:hypothetical protein